AVGRRAAGGAHRARARAAVDRAAAAAHVHRSIAGAASHGQRSEMKPQRLEERLEADGQRRELLAVRRENVRLREQLTQSERARQAAEESARRAWSMALRPSRVI